MLRSILIVAGVALLGLPTAGFGQVPAAPSDANTIVRGEHAIDVTWVDNSDNEIAFDVFRKDGVGSLRPIAAVDANLTVFHDRESGIVPNVRYCYEVRARNASGQSEPSNQACLTVPPRPASPSGLIASRADNNSPIVLSWIINSTNEDGFLLYRDTKGTGYVLEDTVAAGVNRATDYDVRTNGQYCYFVSAFNISGESVGSAPFCIDVVVGDPTLPTSFTATALSGSEIDLAWEYAQLITHSSLGIERSIGGADPWTEIFSTTELVTDYHDSMLASDTEYCYRLVMESASGSIGMTDQQCAQTDFSVPPIPKDVNAVGRDDGTVELTWSLDPSPGVLFRIDRRIGLGTFEPVADSLNVFKFTDIGLSASEIYCYRVQAFNPGFESDFSAPACSILAPGPVTNLQVTAGPGHPTSELTASWQPTGNTAPTSYEVSYRETGAADFSTPMVTSAMSMVIGGLDDLTEYDVRVVAYRAVDSLSARSEPQVASGKTLLSVWPGDMDDDGQVTASDAVMLTSDACYGKATSLNSKGLDVSWVEQAIDPAGDDPTVIRCDADRNGTVEIFDFLAIAANSGRTTGKIDVEATAPPVITSEAQRKRLQQILETFVPAPGQPDQTRLKENLTEILSKATSEIIPDHLSLGAAYPNPATSTVTVPVDLPEDASIRLSLVNVAGQEVRNVVAGSRPAGRHRIAVEVSNLPAGVYFMILDAEGSILTRAVTVAH